MHFTGLKFQKEKIEKKKTCFNAFERLRPTKQT